MIIRLHHWVEENLSFIRISDLPKEDQEDFRNWLKGAQVPIIPELMLQDAVYLTDYQTWYHRRNK